MLNEKVDILYNEDFVHLFYNIGKKLGYLKTGRDEVGEEELFFAW
jgi:hypothetical protein